jgi:alpha-1,2-mannosyltransferase
MHPADSPAATFAGLDQSERRRRLGLAVLVAAAMVIQLSLVIRMVVAIGHGFLPHDFLAYDGAARHLLAGQPLYDTTATETGGLGLFLYPPSFALLMLPMTLVPSSIGAPIWMFGLVVVGLVAVWLMPVSRVIRWGLTFALGLSYPFLDAVAQGQVGPVLLLLFVIGWRAIAGRRATLGRERAVLLGIVLGLGATIKIQPAISIAWAALTRRFRAAIVAIAIAGGLAILATVIVGPQAWLDLVAVLARTNEPVNTRDSVGIARVAFELGASPGAAYGLYVIGIVGSAIAVLAAIRYGSASSSYVVAAIASQMVSPVVWAHYAVVLLLPVAWLLARRRWWAILVLVPTSVPIADVAPSIVYPIVFWATTVAVLREGVLERRATATRETLREQGIPDPGAILAG